MGEGQGIHCLQICCERNNKRRPQTCSTKLRRLNTNTGSFFRKYHGLRPEFPTTRAGILKSIFQYLANTQMCHFVYKRDNQLKPIRLQIHLNWHADRIQPVL